MWKRLTICLFLSVSAQASEIDDLIATSSDITQTFDYGIKAIAGSTSFAETGGIAPTGITSDGLVTYTQAEAYNQALQSFKTATAVYDAGAQQYLDAQSVEAMQDMRNAVDVYVQAAGALIEVVEINRMAADAAGTPQAAEVQAYVAENEVSLTLQQPEVDVYNESLTNVEVAAQSAAAFTAAASSVDLVQTANDQAVSMQATFSEASGAYFDNQQQQVVIDFAQHTMAVTLAVGQYFQSVVDVLAAGEQDPFYTTSPTQNQCFYTQDQQSYEECIATQ